MRQFTSDRMDSLINIKIKPNMKAIYNMRVKGLPDRMIAKFLGCSERDFRKAIDESEELQEVYNDATILLCSELRDVVIGRALGKDGKTDKDGNELGPDSNLAMRVLEKIDPQFSKKEETNVMVVTVEDIIRELNEKRRQEIEKAKEIEMRNVEKGYDII
jgi:hypothetical protein